MLFKLFTVFGFNYLEWTLLFILSGFLVGIIILTRGAFRYGYTVVSNLSALFWLIIASFLPNSMSHKLT